MINNIEVELKEKDNSIFTKEFLISTEQNNIVDTIENELIKTIKGFAWVLANVTSKSNINFIIRDNFKGYNLKDSHLIVIFHSNLKEMNLNLMLSTGLRFKDDKQF